MITLFKLEGAMSYIVLNAVVAVAAIHLTVGPAALPLPAIITLWVMLIAVSINMNAWIIDMLARNRQKKTVALDGTFYTWNVLHFKRVSKNDVDLIYEWANDVETRKHSFNTAPIDHETHVHWFNAKLVDHRCHFFILYHDDVPVAQLRVQIDNAGVGVISYSVAKEHREKGYGVYLCNAIPSLAAAHGIRVQVLRAEVKKSNLPGIKTLNRAGYDRTDAGDIYVFEKRVVATS